jgi:hypothetical protein
VPVGSVPPKSVALAALVPDPVTAQSTSEATPVLVRVIVNV